LDREPARRPDSEQRTASRPPRIFHLHPGQIFIASDGSQVLTILGSCVAVCLWDPGVRIGGLNHFLLPTGDAAPADALRYGDRATTSLIEKLCHRGASRSRLGARIFGGACTLTVSRPGDDPLGLRNAAAALAVLEAHRIPVLERHIGGHQARKLHFSTVDGTVAVRVV
jgi:chemotaxis protein CheD